jgi:hypothetical protein
MKKHNHFCKSTARGSMRGRLTFLISLGLVITLLGCEDFVSVDRPDSQLDAGAVFEDKATATAAMTDIYSKVRDNGMLSGSASGLSVNLGHYADELDFYGTPQSGTVFFYNNSLIASSSDIREYWNSGYNQIYATNAVIEGVTASTILSETDKAPLEGEALFVRGLLHFYLTNLYGAVPYITTTDYTANKAAFKIPTAAVYTQVINDLVRAIALLPEEYTSPERTRPNKYAARALLARVYLYAGLWNEASNEASAVLNNTGLYLNESDPDRVFLMESTATIWQLAPGFSGGNTLEGITFNFTSGPPPLTALTPELFTSFEPGDQRRERWIETISDGVTSWYRPVKYKAVDNTAATENSIVLRLGELCLIRAEARAHAGDIIGAKEDVDAIRQLAGLPATAATTQAELLDAILRERRAELFTEFGHRFFDLKRFGKLNEALSLVKPGWNPTDNLFPLPEAELGLNPNLQPQNPGY